MSGPFNYIPFGDNPGQLYPLASQDTYASQGSALSVIGSGGSGPSPGGIISTPGIYVTGQPDSPAQEAGITLAGIVGSPNSVLILFNDISNNNPQIGQLCIGKNIQLTSISQQSPRSGLAVSAYSTIYGAYQPVGCSDLFLYSTENDGTNFAYSLESKNTPISSLNVQAPNVNISSLIGVSSVNGIYIDWAKISTLAGAP